MVRRSVVIALGILTLASVWFTVRGLSFSSNLVDLFPGDLRAQALARYSRALGGGDVGLILVRGDDAKNVANAANAASEALAGCKSVEAQAIHAPSMPFRAPSQVWAFAGARARERLRQILSPEGMHKRLEESRAMLLAPSGNGASEWVARDPLRLAQVPWEGRMEWAPGVASTGGDAFVADEGRARIILWQTRSTSMQSDKASAIMKEVEGALDHVRHGYPSVRLDATGAQAISAATEALIRRDLEISATVSLLIVSFVFLALFRRARAILAILLPLALGTLWTTGFAGAGFSKLSAISMAFGSVVVGVGLDTGVHVYAALLEGRRRGLSPTEAAAQARRTCARPLTVAAVTAGATFAAMCLSTLPALRELGALCAAGEVLTAIAILIFTPWIGARLERREPPRAPDRSWPFWFGSAVATKTRALVILATGAALIIAAMWTGTSVGEHVVALRPKAIVPLQVLDDVYALFGGKPGQWIVLATDPNEEQARSTADVVAEKLESLQAAGVIDGFDSLSNVAPSRSTRDQRLAERDSLYGTALRTRLGHALEEVGFDPAAFEEALTDVEHPLPVDHHVELPAWIVSRHLARDEGGVIDAMFVRPKGTRESDALALETISHSAPGVIVTGYPFLEQSLRDALRRDLPKVGILAMVVVLLTVGWALRRATLVLAVAFVLAVEIAMVALLMHAFGVTWNAYNALVLPVLLGITLDEVMFVLHATREAASSEDPLRAALGAQGPLVTTTALTTAAGFGALLTCRFDGLRDMGAVGALGSIAGLCCALVFVPAWVKAFGGLARQPDVAPPQH